MQLKKIKLSGFKSFVDPTVVPIPSNLVAIVGPNGCGKSNIIDAVCWVMGESSAKYLRGESLTDVIFNGSSTRKPVGQATVELIFDNQDGSVGGEYASYAEISIRRVLNRDSESGYFLNGTRCRRRDIIDIFLGTGLGPRSYSIIGQNMIARIIEAKPDDMRTYLEEAAGISKYKERRRETENRIRDTKENMARLDDVRAELDKQLTHLKRQASAAEKFKTLKQEERNARAQWLTAEWRQHDKKLVQYSLQIQQQETSLAAEQAELGENQLNTDRMRNDYNLANEAFQEVQRRYYAAGNEITRIEQDIHHAHERRRQWQADIDQAQSDWTEVKNNLEEMEHELSELIDETRHLEPELRDVSMSAVSAIEGYSQAEKTMQSWQNGWDEFNQRLAKITQTAEVERTRIVYLEQQLTSFKQYKTQCEAEQAQINFKELNTEIADLSQQVSQATTLSAKQNQQLIHIQQEMGTAEVLQQQTVRQLDQVRNHLQQLRGKQASLEALQQTALGQRDNPNTAWLTKHKLDQLPRLAQCVEVESGWEQAVEKVLGTNLQAICVDTLLAITDVIDEFTQGSLSVFAPHASSSSSLLQATLLLSKIKSPWPLDSLLAGVYTAETRAEALELCQTLASHESVITREGIWLSAAWLRISHEENPAAGIFQREQELKQLAKQIAEQAKIQVKLEKDLAQNREHSKELESHRDDLQKAVNQSYAKMTQLQAQQKIKQEWLANLTTRAKQLDAELENNLNQYEQTNNDLAQTRLRWQEAMNALEKLAGQRNTRIHERDKLRENLHASREQLNEVKEQQHQLEIRLQTTKSQQASSQHTLSRMQAQLATLAERKKILQADFDVETPLVKLESALSMALSHRLQIEEELNRARNAINEVNQALHAIEDARHGIEGKIAAIRDMLETLRLENQSVKVKTETILEQLKEMQLRLEDVLKDLSEDASPELCHQQLEQMTARITRLGPINLVAIEEYTACAERKEYLDKQYADLFEGLATLENAIAKIDKETRARFKETFDKVNERFQELFPKVFGGGYAYLELTGENLLDAGISIMACPPGKRNSTIHLLSGGEKAMAAIALVFSIFHLNPAPFCLLDEVDAPLDDANIGRFCQLVKAMAEKTQFIFISHNKLAIEMGDHLMGVTMQEPGVSRLVSVNMEEAVSLAGA